MIKEIKYLPKEEGVSGNPIHITYDDGKISVFNYAEDHPLYKTIQEWEAIDGNTIAPAD